MNKPSLLLTVLIITYFESFSQIVFEKGYIIDDSNTKTECLIKNKDWKDNPSEFEYKLSENGEINRGTIQNIKEFGVLGSERFVMAKVKIDRLLNNLSNISNDRNPVFNDETLFLKVVVEGKATLYSYEAGDLSRFFYKSSEGEINQLIFKEYRVNNIVGQGPIVKQNNSFKQQLSQILKCETLKDVEFEMLKYYKRDFERIFVKYNKCADPNYVRNATRPKRYAFNLTIRPGFSVSDIALRDAMDDDFNIDFTNKFGFRFGIEGEFVLPYNKGRWAVLAEPTYQHLSAQQSKATNNPSYGVIVAELVYSSIELPVGLRYYISLGKDSKIFINAHCVPDFSFNSTIKFKKGNGSDLNSPLIIKSEINPALGLGYKVKNKFVVELRYQKYRDILAGYFFWKAKYSSSAIIIGYTF